VNNIRDCRSRHNQLYWDYDASWFSIGLGATSYVNQTIVTRPKPMSDYIKWVDEQLSSITPDLCTNNPTSNNNYNVSDSETVDLEEVMDIVLKRLRTSDGLSLRYIRTRYGDQVVDAIIKGVGELGIKYNMATIDTTNEVVRLVDPTGFLFSDTIISNIFYELEAI
jgi:coproporphyrinogen III oxidase-like Fe-S oxidoreductase